MAPIYRSLQHLTRKPALKFAEILIRLDLLLAEGDVQQSSKFALDLLTEGHEFIGVDRVPSEGPLLVVANHAGAADSIGAFSCVSRKDSKIVAGRRPMLEVLPNISRYLIYLDIDPIGRMYNMHMIINKLKAGETVILFPHGSLEPDPALIPGALKSIKAWSESVGVFLAKVPEAKLLPLLISQTVVPKAWKSLFATWSTSTKRRHQIAMMTQFAMQRLQRGDQWKIPLRIQVGDSYDPRTLSGSLDPREINVSVRQIMSDLLLSSYPTTA
jgi:1-acyl-sn-glycerol-3-phosphate acyltransferase